MAQNFQCVSYSMQLLAMYSGPGSWRCEEMETSVKRGYPIKLIKLKEFDEEICSEGRPVLILCVRRDYQFSSQTDLIRNLLERADQGCSIALKVCLMDEESPEEFNDRLDLQGSPAFLLYENGKEKDRLLGVADEARLKGFLRNSLGWSM